MINCTNAYVTLRQQAAELFDVTVGMCYAVPVFREQIRVIRKGIADEPASPDHFRGERSLEEVGPHVAGYRFKLARYVLLSSSGFFDAYVKDVISEEVLTWLTTPMA